METNQALCEQLIQADDENDVVEILKNAGYWDVPNAWRDLGDNENNFAPAGAQQANPIAALVEKIVNSADARLMNEALIRGIDPTSDEAPNSVREAVAAFIEESQHPENESNGRIENWTDTERNEQAQKITLAATGSKSSPSITIADLGEGQTPDRVSETFMSVNRSNKLRVHFVQGKFNMGGTGALRFCGTKRLQLIVTRRNPELVGESKNADDQLWSFTVVRRDAPKSGEKSSVYRYLAPVDADTKRKGGVLRFVADELNILPFRNEPYSRAAKYGSLVKLYNYQFKGRSNILMKDGLLRAVDVRLPNPALPVMFHECRDYKGGPGSFSNPGTGLFVRLSDNTGENLEENFPLTTTMTVDGHKFSIRIFGFKRKRAATYLNRSEGVLFLVNGQTQGDLHSRFYKASKTNLNYVADSLLTCVDCSELDRWGQEELFMNTRENLAESEFRQKVEAALQSLIRSHPALREFNNKRRAELVKDKLSDDKPLEDTLRSVLKRDPTLASLFLAGERLSSPHDTSSASKKKIFVGKKFPTFFRHLNKDDDYTRKRDCQLDREFRLAFETDAENRYFGRSKEPGRYTVQCLNGNGDEVILNDNTPILFEGVCNITFSLPACAAVGSTYTVNVTVTDDSQVEPFSVCTTIKVVPKRVTTNTGTAKNRRKKDNEDNTESEDKKSAGIQLPTATPVQKDEWDDHEFDKFSALKIVPSDQDNGKKRSFDFFLNVDNMYLQNELKRTKSDEALLKKQFEIALILIGLSMIYERRNDPDTEALQKQVLDSTRAISMVLLPMLRSLGELTVDTTDEIADAA